ncbi:MAG: hypothetical protein J7M05_07210 [Anaerolineae bacterium]|nr:hypothetical protein [Anaerolineae bacterium]
MPFVRETIWNQPRARLGWPQALATLFLLGLGWVAQRSGWLPLQVGFLRGFGAALTLQMVGAIWFGIWGILAGSIALFLPGISTPTYPLPEPLAQLPAYLCQGLLVSWAFRHFRADPRLRTNRDWAIWTFWGVLLSNALGGALVALSQGLLAELPKASWKLLFLHWWASNTISVWFLGTVLLKFLSPLIVRSPAFCSRYLR